MLRKKGGAGEYRLKKAQRFDKQTARRTSSPFLTRFMSQQEIARTVG